MGLSAHRWDAHTQTLVPPNSTDLGTKHVSNIRSEPRTASVLLRRTRRSAPSEHPLRRYSRCSSSPSEITFFQASSLLLTSRLVLRKRNVAISKEWMKYLSI
ncbi:unnamed protein product [Cuscuta epithymum]|uniref:Uncharacterized protein n=1 Tax=Cuscuta epithymum TaxID=186058 RepID=A0AAV0ERV6_9ASTE|nr:unnamed protein product [Cuscuta epithymum]